MTTTTSITIFAEEVTADMKILGKLSKDDEMKEISCAGGKFFGVCVCKGNDFISFVLHFLILCLSCEMENCNLHLYLFLVLSPPLPSFSTFIGPRPALIV